MSSSHSYEVRSLRSPSLQALIPPRVTSPQKQQNLNPSHQDLCGVVGEGADAESKTFIKQNVQLTNLIKFAKPPESWSLTAFWRRSSLFLISMIWSSVATFLNLDDLILCCFWFLCQHCSLSGSKIPRPRNRQDWFLRKTDQNSWQRTLQIVSFLAERISRTLPLLFKPSPKTPRAHAHLFKQREKKNHWPLCFLLFCCDEQQLGFSTWTIVLNPWQVWARPPCFLFNSVEKLKQVRSFWPLQPKCIIYHKKSLIVLKAWGLRRLCYKVLLSFEHFIQDKSLK